MDPILFKQQLEPLSKYKQYNVDEILKICYPLKGVWEWSMIENCNKSILRIFKMVHLRPDQYLMVEPDWITDAYMPERIEGIEYDERWNICWESTKDFKSSYLYSCLDQLLEVETEKESESLDWDYGTSSSESSEETVSFSESVKEIEFSVIERDQAWKDRHPAYNPRFYDDIELGYLEPPVGLTKDQILEIIDTIQSLSDDEFVAADGTGEIAKDGIQEFAIFGKPLCLLAVKVLRFFKSHVDEYSLAIDVSQWVTKAEKRTNVWKWIRVGNGFYRDFEWMFLGDKDCITKTVRVLNEMGYQPLPKRNTGKEFDFDPSDIFKLSGGKCLNIDTQKAVKSKKADPYNWVSKNMSKKRVLEVRGYIHDFFVGMYPERIIPGKKNSWSKEFLKSLPKKKGQYINFSTLKPIKYTATTSILYEFSNMGFAVLREDKNFKVKDIERIISKK